MKKFYGNTRRMIPLTCTGLVLLILSVIVGLLYSFSYGAFFILTVSLIILLVALFLSINKVYVNADAIKFSFVHTKAEFNRADLKEIFIAINWKITNNYSARYYHYKYSITYMILCFYDFSHADNNLDLWEFRHKYASSPNFKMVYMEYNKKLFEELTKSGYVKVTGNPRERALISH